MGREAHHGLKVIQETLHLEREKARPQSVDGLLQYVMALPADKRFTVEVEESRDRLPSNLLARLKIPVRKMAKHLDLSYEQLNEIIHDRLYPKRDKTVGGVTYQVFVPSNELTDNEAREIEVGVLQLAADIGCDVSKDNWSIPEPQEEARA